MRLLGPLCGLLLVSLLGACATPQTSRILAEGGHLPQQAEVADVPFYPQKRYYCGPAALAMVMTWSGEPVTQDELVPQVYTPSRQGTLRNDMLAAARRRGRLAVQVSDLRSLLAELAAGNPVVVFQNLALDWFPQWHYAVAYGYDLQKREIVLRSGTEARRVTDLYAFERTWERGDYWGLVVLPPERLPATADERSVLDAAAGLERTQHLREAASAYMASCHVGAKASPRGWAWATLCMLKRTSLEPREPSERRHGVGRRRQLLGITSPTPWLRRTNTTKPSERPKRPCGLLRRARKSIAIPCKISPG